MKKGNTLAITCAYVLVAILLALIGVGCGAETPKKEQIPLVEGATAYIRVKEYVTKSLDSADLKGAETTLNFGQIINLIQRKDGYPTMWLVSIGEDQSWVPAYLLTANRDEIDFLKENNRIPATMTFIYKEDDIVRVWGLVAMGFLVVDSEGMAATAEGSSQVAFENNGILFDKSAVEHEWKNPMIFSNGNTTYKLDSEWLYYYIGNESFDCIDLAKLAFCK